MSVAVLSESRSFDRTLEFTRDAIMREVKDLAFDHSPLLSMMAGRLLNAEFGTVRMAGRGKQVQVGGESVRIRHNLGKNTTAKTLTGPWDTVDTSPSDTVRGSRANWTHYSSTVTLSATDLIINRGADALSSLLDFEVRNSVTSLADLLGDHIYSGSAGTQVTGIDTLIGTGTVQGLAPATYTEFASRGLSARGTAVASVSFASGSFATQGISDMRTLWLNASEGAIQPQVTLSDYTTFSRYEGSLQAQERFTSTGLGDAGFQSLAFKTAPFMPDSKATSGSLYMLNLDFLKLIVLQGADFDAGPFTEAEQQEAKTSKVMWKGQLVIMDRRFCNRMTSITA